MFIKIDTEGSFMIERVVQIANSTINYIKEAFPNCKNISFIIVISHINFFIMKLLKYIIYITQ